METAQWTALTLGACSLLGDHDYKAAPHAHEERAVRSFSEINLRSDPSATAAEAGETSDAEQCDGAWGWNRTTVNHHVVNASGAAGLVSAGAIDRINSCLHAHEDGGSVVSGGAESPVRGDSEPAARWR